MLAGVLGAEGEQKIASEMKEMLGYALAMVFFLRGAVYIFGNADDKQLGQYNRAVAVPRRTIGKKQMRRRDAAVQKTEDGKMSDGIGGWLYAIFAVSLGVGAAELLAPRSESCADM